MSIINFFKTYQKIIVLIIGYIAVAGLAFGIGRMTLSTDKAPEIKIEQAFSPLNNTLNTADNQSKPQVSGQTSDTTPGNGATTECKGQIKGNIGSSGKIYHIQGSSAYNRTDPEQCFNTEAEAQAAGFRKAGN